MPLKPSIPKGTRDFSPEEIIKRDYIFDNIRSVFRLHGYHPLETPAMENLSTLLGKYGIEGDKLLFRILNSGNFLSGISESDIKEYDPAAFSSKICEKGLRYDLTVPFARYVVQHRNELIFPFKRYQIQPVWRADKPQKGRYREFYQCDADVIGSDSLLNEFELVRIIDEVFTKLNISVIIRINNRKILAGIAELTGEGRRLTDITVAIDKLDRAGMDSVENELLSKGISTGVVESFKNILGIGGSNSEKINRLKQIFSSPGSGQKGMAELETLFRLIESDPLRSPVVLDLTLARGLDYYTGAIIEVKSADVNIGSLCGGGRYDNLTGIFGLEGVSGVGISFGADRICDVMTQTEGFSKISPAASEVMIVNFGEPELPYAVKVMKLLHNNGISAQLYPDNVKIGKQLAYANAIKIPFVVIAGGDEIKSGEVTIRNMAEGSQYKITLEKLPEFFKTR
ncbi:MAG: histidine--tRNA ligase [Bacteroidales bacterium]